MLQIIILNGEQQGDTFSLFEGLTIGPNQDSDIVVNTTETLEAQCDSKGSFTLVSKSKKSVIELGGESLSKIELLPGIIFSTSEIGFSIQEGACSKNSDSNKKILKSSLFKENETVIDTVSVLKQPVELNFVRGALLNTKVKVNWQPFAIGSQSNVHHFIDENIKLNEDILVFEHPTTSGSDQLTMRPTVSNFIQINQQLVSKPTIVKDGDLVEFSDTAFYIRIK